MRRCARHPHYEMPSCFHELSASMLNSLCQGCCSPQLADKIAETRLDYVPKELADITVHIANVAYPSFSKSKDISSHALLVAKRRAVENLIQSISPNLIEENRAELANKMLNEIWNG